jgi:hypothetical protein
VTEIHAQHLILTRAPNKAQAMPDVLQRKLAQNFCEKLRSDTLNRVVSFGNAPEKSLRIKIKK